MKKHQPVRLFNFLFTTQSNHPHNAFRERAIRIIVLIATSFFSIFFLFDILINDMQLSALGWYGLIYGIASTILIALHYRKVDLASYCLISGLLLILLDPTAAYWSPGTVVLCLIFTFAFQILITNERIRVGAIFINLGIYTYLVMSASRPSPLMSADYFSAPLTALLAVYTSHGIIIGISHLIRREQQLRDQQELLIEQQRVEILRQFLGHSSHDLRTLLSRISSSLYLAKRKLPETEHSVLNGLTDASDDLQKLVLSMLDMAQLRDDTDLVLTAIPVDKLINRVIDQHQDRIDEKKETIQITSQTTSINILVDEDYIQRALSNVLLNAIIYTPEGGDIKISTCVEKQTVVINISDTGIGISAEQLPLIFDSFYRGDSARNQSTGLNGLGLSISKKIIDLHKGTISVASELGKGSIFTIRLPIA